MEGGALIVVDSCMWDYYLDPTTKEHEPVREELERLIRTTDILTSTIIWMEVSHYLYKVSKLPREGIESRLRVLMRLSTMRVEALDLGLFYESLKVLSELWTLGVGGRDATVLAMMRRYGVREIFTHDKGFKELAKLGIVEVIDPIKR